MAKRTVEFFRQFDSTTNRAQMYSGFGCYLKGQSIPKSERKEEVVKQQFQRSNLENCIELNRSNKQERY